MKNDIWYKHYHLSKINNMQSNISYKKIHYLSIAKRIQMNKCIYHYQYILHIQNYYDYKSNIDQ